MHGRESNDMQMNSGPDFKFPPSDNWVSVLCPSAYANSIGADCPPCRKLKKHRKCYLLSQGSIKLSAPRIKVLDKTYYSSLRDIYHLGEENCN